MKKGINAWTLPAGMGLDKSFPAVKQAGFDGFELNMEKDEGAELNLHLNSTERDLAKILALSKENGLPVTSISTNLHWKRPLTDNDAATAEEGRAIARKMIDAAAFLGADTVLIVPGLVTASVAYDTAYDRALAALLELRGYAEQKKIFIGIENVWNKFLLSPLEMRRFIEEVGSDYVRAYFDAGNVLQFGFPEQWVNILGKYIVKVHIKDFDTSIGNISGFKALLHGSMNFAALVSALRNNGYDGYLTVELGPYRENPLQSARDASAALDYIINL